MKNLAAGALKVDVRISGSSVIVSWWGESIARSPELVLNPYLAELLPQMKGQRVVLRFNALDYMNSSSVTPIMQFIRRLSAVATSVCVQYREDVQWQVTSFRAMRVVARKWDNVEVVGS